MVCQAGAASAPDGAEQEFRREQRRRGRPMHGDEAREDDPDRDDAELRGDQQPARSATSASAPAGTVKRNIGAMVATWTADTINGFGLRLVISQLIIRHS